MQPPTFRNFSYHLDRGEGRSTGRLTGGVSQTLSCSLSTPKPKPEPIPSCFGKEFHALPLLLPLIVSFPIFSTMYVV